MAFFSNDDDNYPQPEPSFLSQVGSFLWSAVKWIAVAVAIATGIGLLVMKSDTVSDWLDKISGGKPEKKGILGIGHEDAVEGWGTKLRNVIRKDVIGGPAAGAVVDAVNSIGNKLGYEGQLIHRKSQAEIDADEAAEKARQEAARADALTENARNTEAVKGGTIAVAGSLLAAKAVYQDPFEAGRIVGKAGAATVDAVVSHVPKPLRNAAGEVISTSKDIVGKAATNAKDLAGKAAEPFAENFRATFGGRATPKAAPAAAAVPTPSVAPAAAVNPLTTLEKAAADAVKDAQEQVKHLPAKETPASLYSAENKLALKAQQAAAEAQKAFEDARTAARAGKVTGAVGNTTKVAEQAGTAVNEVAQAGGFTRLVARIAKFLENPFARKIGYAGAVVGGVADNMHAVELYKQGETGLAAVQSVGGTAESVGYLAGPAFGLGMGGVKDILAVANMDWKTGEMKTTRSGLSSFVGETLHADQGVQYVAGKVLDSYYDVHSYDREKAQLTAKFDKLDETDRAEVRAILQEAKDRGLTRVDETIAMKVFEHRHENGGQTFAAPVTPAKPKDEKENRGPRNHKPVNTV